MKTINLRWMFKEPNKPVEERNFNISFADEDERSEKELKLAQDLVKGYVEVVWIGGEVKAMVNEEAMYVPGMEPNCGFLGNIIFFREVMEDGEACWGSLTDDDVRKIKAWTITHESDIHPGNTAVQVLTGKDIDTYRQAMHELQKSKDQEWDSF